MYLDNSVIVLIACYVLKNEKNIVSYKQLQEFLPLEKSQISQALKSDEEATLLQKPEGNKYFSKIELTPMGIQKAERYISFLQKLVNSHPLLSPQKLNPQSNNPIPPPNINSVVDKLSTSLFSPLKSTLKKSLQEYIPNSGLDENMIDDLADDVITFFQNKVENFEK